MYSTYVRLIWVRKVDDNSHILLILSHNLRIRKKTCQSTRIKNLSMIYNCYIIHSREGAATVYLTCIANLLWFKRSLLPVWYLLWLVQWLPKVPFNQPAESPGNWANSSWLAGDIFTLELRESVTMKNRMSIMHELEFQLLLSKPIWQFNLFCAKLL